MALIPFKVNDFLESQVNYNTIPRSILKDTLRLLTLGYKNRFL